MLKDILDSFKRELGEKIIEARIEEKVKGEKRLWLVVRKDSFKRVVKHLFLAYPNTRFAVASGYDADTHITLIYHFFVSLEGKAGDASVNIKVDVPKNNPVLPTITDIVPGALISERELQEMLGVKIKDIPDPRRIFLSNDFPKGIYPWRRDEYGPERIVRDLHRGDKE
ncbi:MAG TPA: hydrogenase [Candidatus Aenigmarchaeota archaeon]|nr:MAG: hydrogenase [Candidatus Aenigmarchaeota archaeon]HDD46329.1 hydrogenase [Candidatus Aenigmarchaeota archaeon]